MMRKANLLILITLFVSSLGLGQVSDTSDYEINVPEYQSNGEILIQFIIPFLTVFVVLFWVLRHALHFTFHDEDSPPWEKPDVNKYALLISLSISLAVIVSPFWEYFSQYIASLGTIFIGVLGVFLFFIMYIMS